uniref:Lipase/esterase n=1 Tax=bacterium enrichment culture TaxID=207831 RepID=A0A0R7N6G6_9BACT|nr:lipase/esterase [uncultured bacterium]AKQ70955.1 lipase/esterase [bacterium enrichment culture]
MSAPITRASALPPYAKFISPAKGGWQRWATNLLFRLTAKRMLRPDSDLGELRAKVAEMDAKFGHVDAAAKRTPVDCNGVPAEWISVPESRPERVLFYLHGGAFMFRMPGTHAAMVARWCRRLGARTLMVDYRLAPEHRYPAAPDDCHAAYRWLLAQGCDPRSIVIGGDSAGGNLTLATLHRVKLAGEPLPACAVLLSPFVDFTLSGASLYANEDRDPMFTLAGMVALRAHYAPPERFLDPPLSPLFGDFHGLPPMLFQAGSEEMLVDESVRAAAKAHACGVPVELELWDRLPHVFQALEKLPQAAEAAEHIVRFIGERAGWR